MVRDVEPGTERADERRSSPRVDVETEVTLESESNFYTGLTHDISGGGLFVSTHQVRRIGDRVTVRFTMPGASLPIVADCEVRWVRQDSWPKRSHDAPSGMGLRFLGLTPQEHLLIATFLEARESIFFDDE